MILSMLNKQLAGPGIYQNIGILTDGNDADITYTNANITQYYGSPVPFRAISPGYLNLEFYGVKLKDRIKGFFSVKIEGTQEICLDPTWDSSQLCSSETEIPITGTIQGNFDGYLLYKTESGI